MMNDIYSSATPNVIAASTTTVLGLTGALYYYYRRPSPPISATEECIELNSFEQTLLEYDELPISTITWFEGNYETALPVLLERLCKIVSHNQWLTGRVVKRANYTRPVIAYEPRTSDSTNTPFAAEDLTEMGIFHVVDPHDSPIHYDMNLRHLGKALKPYQLLKNGPNELLYKVTVIPCSNNPQQHFGLAVSVSHLPADGCTFYILHHWLCGQPTHEGGQTMDSVQTLPVQRIPTTKQQQAEALGKEESTIFAAWGFYAMYTMGLLEAWFGRIFLGRTMVYDRAFILDAEKLQTIKQQHKTAGSGSGTDGSDYISTNDIVTSWFFQKTKTDIGLMIINTRGRLEGHSPLHAGNYENVLCYQPPDFESPGLIRQSIAKLKRVVTADTMPTQAQLARSKWAIADNIYAFKDREFFISKHHSERLHIPIRPDVIDYLLPTNLAFCILWRVAKGKLGVYLLGPPNMMKDLHICPFESDTENPLLELQ